jgi:hypothetical protein
MHARVGVNVDRASSLKERVGPQRAARLFRYKGAAQAAAPPSAAGDRDQRRAKTPASFRATASIAIARLSVDQLTGARTGTPAGPWEHSAGD